MESYGSMHFHVWNHIVPCMELHGMSLCHGSMHGIAWNHTDHMVPCVELHGSLMNLDPGKLGAINFGFYSFWFVPYGIQTILIYVIRTSLRKFITENFRQA